MKSGRFWAGPSATPARGARGGSATSPAGAARQFSGVASTAPPTFGFAGPSATVGAVGRPA
eukprot:9414970-Lingulodinium_polyedra.AAC.1